MRDLQWGMGLFEYNQGAGWLETYNGGSGGI